MNSYLCLVKSTTAIFLVTLMACGSSSIRTYQAPPSKPKTKVTFTIKNIEGMGITKFNKEEECIEEISASRGGISESEPTVGYFEKNRSHLFSITVYEGFPVTYENLYQCGFNVDVDFTNVDEVKLTVEYNEEKKSCSLNLEQNKGDSAGWHELKFKSLSSLPAKTIKTCKAPKS